MALAPGGNLSTPDTGPAAGVPFPPPLPWYISLRTPPPQKNARTGRANPKIMYRSGGGTNEIMYRKGWVYPKMVPKMYGESLVQNVNPPPVHFLTGVVMNYTWRLSHTIIESKNQIKHFCAWRASKQHPSRVDMSRNMLGSLPEGRTNHLSRRRTTMLCWSLFFFARPVGGRFCCLPCWGCTVAPRGPTCDTVCKFGGRGAQRVVVFAIRRPRGAGGGRGAQGAVVSANLEAQWPPKCGGVCRFRGRGGQGA